MNYCFIFSNSFSLSHTLSDSLKFSYLSIWLYYNFSLRIQRANLNETERERATAVLYCNIKIMINKRKRSDLVAFSQYHSHILSYLTMGFLFAKGMQSEFEEWRRRRRRRRIRRRVRKTTTTAPNTTKAIENRWIGEREKQTKTRKTF